jgi:hypothetical protein
MVSLVLANTTIEMRHLNVSAARPGVPRVFDVEFFSVDGHGAATFGCDQAGWLSLSLDGGATYTAVPASVQAGIALAAFSPGERRAAKLKLLIPAGTVRRQAFIDLPVGLGT